MKYCPKCRTEYEDWPTMCADCQISLVNKLPPEEISVPKKSIMVFTSTYGFEANMVKSILESVNLHPVIYDEHTVQMQPLYSYAIGGVKVLVPEEELSEAKTLINEFLKNKTTTINTNKLSKTDKKRFKKTCLKCGSSNVIKKLDMGKGVLFIYMLSLIGLLLIPFTKKIYICMDCGTKWRV